MGSLYMDGVSLPNLADILRAEGLDVQEWGGWEHNSRSTGGYNSPGVMAVVVHHTASGSGTSFQNDWSYCAQGHQDAPVANCLLGRQGQWGVHAGGASNHAGKGGPWNTSKGQIPLDSANSRTIGIEAQNNGVGENWSPDMVESYEIGVGAMCKAYILQPGSDVPAHFEWAPTRKIDPWGGNTPTPGFPYTGPYEWLMSGFRNGVAGRMAGGLPPVQGGDDVLYRIAIKRDNSIPVDQRANAKFVGMIDANGLGHTISWVRTQAEYDQYKTLKAPERELFMADLQGLILLGPLPTGDTLHTWTGQEFDLHVG